MGADAPTELRAVTEHLPWHSVLKATGAITAILIGGRFLVPLVFRAIGGAKVPEVFTATSLLIVVGTAFLADKAGLSMSLGAFLAGVLLSGSEYRHELKADIEPFEGLLLGLFFMSVGMEAQLGLIVTEPGLIVIGVLAFMMSNIVVALTLGRLAGQDWVHAWRFATALPQGSEFSFVLFGVAVGFGVLTDALASRVTLMVALSLAATPLLFSASEKLLVPRLKRRDKVPVYDTIDEEAAIIICGFGRVGQIVGRVLRMQAIPFIALEKDASQVEVLRRFGAKVYFGNPARPDLLRAAGAKNAKLLVVALEDTDEILEVVDVAQRTFPNLRILARARNRRHAHLLMDRGIAGHVRETFYSSLRLTEMTLVEIGRSSADAARAVDLFRMHDEENLIQAHAYYEDKRHLMRMFRSRQRK